MWGFRKKLTPAIWRSVRNAIQARVKESVVILSGLRLSVDEVERKTERHKLVTWRSGWFPV